MRNLLLILAAGLFVAGLAATQTQSATRMVLFEEWTNTG